jgi:hypothetical protein
MIVKGLLDEDFVNYKKPSMVIMFPTCSFKCDKECGMQVCQNSTLAAAPGIEISYENIVNRYLENHITSAVVFAGLEPFDSVLDVVALIKNFRDKGCNDDIIIYTGYTEQEVSSIIRLSNIKQYSPIIIKYGRFIPNSNSHFDETLGVILKSENQYAKEI